MNNLANVITCFSFFCGFTSIIFSLENKIVFAAWAIILSVILDGVDGVIARVNSVSTEFGKELDSLADIVSFGVAPAILCYALMPQGAYWAANLVLFIYLVCSMTRLAKYNVIPKEELADYFSGLPITVSGGIIAAFVLLYIKHLMIPTKWVFLSLILVLSFLMVSKIKYLKFFKLKRIAGIKKTKYFIIAILVGLIIAPEHIIFSLFAFYVAAVPALSDKCLTNRCE